MGKVKKYLRPDEVADEYSINIGSLANMRSRREGPPYFKAGRRVLYRASDIEKWIESTPVKTTASLR